jgi:hypothetical protein
LRHLDPARVRHEIDPVFARGGKRGGGGKADGGQQNGKLLHGGIPFSGVGWISAVLQSGTLSSEALMECIVALSAGEIGDR